MKKVIFSFLLLCFVLVSSASALRFRGFLFYSGDCPECMKIEDDFRNPENRQILRIEVRDVEDADALYRKNLQNCNKTYENAELPILIIDDVCVSGLTQIKDFLAKLDTDGDVLAVVDTLKNTEYKVLPVANPGVPIEEARKNTLIFIGAMSLGMIILVVFGYIIQGKKTNKKTEVNKPAIIAIATTLLMPFLLAVKAKAFCPVCTVAVGAGLGFAKYLGIDDLISGIWIGGLLLSVSLWTIEWLKKRKWNFKFYKIVTIVLFYGLVVIPFMTGGTIGSPYNKLLGIDKVLFGMILGTAGFTFGMFLSNKFSTKFGGKVLFPFQKVVIPITTLILLSLIFYFLVY